MSGLLRPATCVGRVRIWLAHWGGGRIVSSGRAECDGFPKAKEEMICQLCNVETEGSRGPATGIIRPICPSCGEHEDNALVSSLVETSQQMGVILDMVLNPPKVQELGDVG